MSAPKWVKHQRWGWLPDDVPLFASAPHPGAALIQLVGEEEAFFIDHDSTCPGCLEGRIIWTGDEVPLTTAARDLLDALRAEHEVSDASR